MSEDSARHMMRCLSGTSAVGHMSQREIIRPTSYYAPLAMRSADNDVDGVVLKLWDAHAEQLPIELLDSRQWGSSYWMAWYATIDA